ncbi:hypothetical protein Hs30E_11670 [Lactococcus hodotermopsidis]|uniref:Uncharacterized protein n=2 Tax=Pseudolactococcus hodotermopsidis TaxID=2709157 RepID=A0A6A0BCP1_9LACT|nr:hypothetical protein Hs30E_11670 [Lactococcus hodotermopsidis]
MFYMLAYINTFFNTYTGFNTILVNGLETSESTTNVLLNLPPFQGNAVIIIYLTIAAILSIVIIDKFIETGDKQVLVGKAE